MPSSTRSNDAKLSGTLALLFLAAAVSYLLAYHRSRHCCMPAHHRAMSVCADCDFTRRLQHASGQRRQRDVGGWPVLCCEMGRETTILSAERLLPLGALTLFAVVKLAYECYLEHNLGANPSCKSPAAGLHLMQLSHTHADTSLGARTAQRRHAVRLCTSPLAGRRLFVAHFFFSTPGLEEC